MNDFWARHWHAEWLAGKARGAAALRTVQDAAEQAGHAFYKVDGPFAALDDLADEVRELDEAIREQHDKNHIRNEIGDVIFSLVNICRQQGVDFEEAMHRASLRWLARKALQEEKILGHDCNWRTIPPEVNRRIWREVKKELEKSEYED